jgi:hypothetical protein
MQPYPGAIQVFCCVCVCVCVKTLFSDIEFKMFLALDSRAILYRDLSVAKITF